MSEHLVDESHQEPASDVVIGRGGDGQESGGAPPESPSGRGGRERHGRDLRQAH